MLGGHPVGPTGVQGHVALDNCHRRRAAGGDGEPDRAVGRDPCKGPCQGGANDCVLALKERRDVAVNAVYPRGARGLCVYAPCSKSTSECLRATWA